MTQNEITLLNLGESLDNAANLDPRGYGVCKLLYKASREYTGKPLCVNAAECLIKTLKCGDKVFILTGFVLSPFNKAETDGAIGSVLLAKALIKAFAVKPIIVCPSEAETAVKSISEYLEADIDVFVFTKNIDNADADAEKLIKSYSPKAVVAVECPGAAENGRYNNAKGADVTNLESKQDVIFDKLKKYGVLNIAIGDLGNEIGMAAISDCLVNKIPVIPVTSDADNIITSTVSDWGCYSLIAMLAYMMNDCEIMHDGAVQEKVMRIACENGLIDMYGEHIPAIDGFSVELTSSIVNVMKELVKSTLSLKDSCKYWFDKLTELKSFE